ncbi:pyruvate kinase 2, cytosolic-like [Silene latifolia]|uniref:pyruvate kinase 2, cytosolic-like n=1 Tax=Silene latifolia TaxID=37657 RepID=UPI003D783C3A
MFLSGFCGFNWNALLQMLILEQQIISAWGTRNNIDIISLHYTRHADNVREVRASFLAPQNIQETQVFAKVETLAGLHNFDEILKEADDVNLSRGSLGIDLLPEKKSAARLV